MRSDFIMGKKKSKGNGEGTIYVNSKTGLYIGQYVIDRSEERRVGKEC